MTPPRLQRTVAQPSQVEGRGYWDGSDVRVMFRPAAPESGLVFVRDDLVEGGLATVEEATIAVHASNRRPMDRRTVLANAHGAEVAMIEHVLAALSGMGVDNCEIGVTAAEMPGCDGSAFAFVQALEQGGYQEQAAISEPLVVSQPVRCGDEHKWIEARPPVSDGLTIEYRLDYGPESAIGRQWQVVQLSPEVFRDELSPARTFVLKSEADAMINSGMAAHVTPQDLLIFHDRPSCEAERQPIDNPLRFEDECVRHKLLDVVGDLALAGKPIVGHLVACCSGHRLNGDLVATLLGLEPNTEQEPRRRSA